MKLKFILSASLLVFTCKIAQSQSTVEQVREKANQQALSGMPAKAVTPNGNDKAQFNLTPPRTYTSRTPDLGASPLSTIYSHDSIMRYRHYDDPRNSEYEEVDAIIGRQPIHLGQGFSWDIYIVIDSKPGMKPVLIARCKASAASLKFPKLIVLGPSNRVIVWRHIFEGPMPKKFRYHYALTKTQYSVKPPVDNQDLPKEAKPGKVTEIKTPIYYYP